MSPATKCKLLFDTEGVAFGQTCDGRFIPKYAYTHTLIRLSIHMAQHTHILTRFRMLLCFRIVCVHFTVLLFAPLGLGRHSLTSNHRVYTPQSEGVEHVPDCWGRPCHFLCWCKCQAAAIHSTSLSWLGRHRSTILCQKSGNALATQ